MRLTVRVTPRAGRDAAGPFDAEGRLTVRVRAAPADGEANAAVTRLLAKALNLASRDVVLVSGASSRVKAFDIPLERAEVESRLASNREP